MQKANTSSKLTFDCLVDDSLAYERLVVLVDSLFSPRRKRDLPLDRSALRKCRSSDEEHRWLLALRSHHQPSLTVAQNGPLTSKSSHASSAASQRAESCDGEDPAIQQTPPSHHPFHLPSFAAVDTLDTCWRESAASVLKFGGEGRSKEAGMRAI
jgi:hypothetical protein